MPAITIVGSCVTRDACEPNEKLSLNFYAARSSFGSAFSEGGFPLPLEQLDPDRKIVSNWQRSMIEIDLNKRLPGMIRSLTPGSTVVIDFIDERFGLLLQGGLIATYSSVLQPAFSAERLKEFELVVSNTNRHFEIWQKGFQKFVEYANSRSLRVLVNNCRWAHQTVSGTPSLREMTLVRSSNEYLDRLYCVASKLNLTLLHSADQEFIAADSHRWGTAPFHYCKDTTAHIRKLILDAASL